MERAEEWPTLSAFSFRVVGFSPSRWIFLSRPKELRAVSRGTAAIARLKSLIAQEVLSSTQSSLELQTRSFWEVLCFSSRTGEVICDLTHQIWVSIRLWWRAIKEASDVETGRFYCPAQVRRLYGLRKKSTSTVRQQTTGGCSQFTAPILTLVAESSLGAAD